MAARNGDVSIAGANRDRNLRVWLLTFISVFFRGFRGNHFFLLYLRVGSAHPTIQSFLRPRFHSRKFACAENCSCVFCIHAILGDSSRLICSFFPCYSVCFGNCSCVALPPASMQSSVAIISFCIIFAWAAPTLQSSAFASSLPLA
jgi:hypothetical protein